MSSQAPIPETVVVLGGTSEIGLAIVRALPASPGRKVVLVGRDQAGLEEAAEGLRGAGTGEIGTQLLDSDEPAEHAAAVQRALQQAAGSDREALVILAVGVLSPREGVPSDPVRAANELAVNAGTAGSLLLQAVTQLRERAPGGTVVVLSSAAAVRPRRANPVYGAGKAALDALAQGLADAVHGSNVRILVVRPGFVRTRMTHGLKPPPLSTDPDAVGRAVVAGLRRGQGTVWVPAAMGPVMGVLRLLPRPLFRRLEL